MSDRVFFIALSGIYNLYTRFFTGWFKITNSAACDLIAHYKKTILAAKYFTLQSCQGVNYDLFKFRNIRDSVRQLFQHPIDNIFQVIQRLYCADFVLINALGFVCQSTSINAVGLRIPSKTTVTTNITCWLIMAKTYDNLKKCSKTCSCPAVTINRPYYNIQHQIPVTLFYTFKQASFEA